MEDNNLNQIMNNLAAIVEDLDNLKQYKEDTIQQLEGVKKELEQLKEVKAEITSQYQELIESINSSKEFLSLVKSTVEEAGKKSDEIKGYLDRMSVLGDKIASDLEEAKQLETRLMLEKMDIMIRQAERLNHEMSSNNRSFMEPSAPESTDRREITPSQQPHSPKKTKKTPAVKDGTPGEDDSGKEA